VNKFESEKWNDVLVKLQSGQVPAERIGSMIVRLGKPYDAIKIDAAKDTVAMYLEHPDGWARHEAMWFLGSWGRLKDYQPALIRALQTDGVSDNRGYAATCLGRMQQGTHDPTAVRALKAVVENEKEDEAVRAEAYPALVEIVRIRPEVIPSLTDRNLGIIDWTWLRSLPD
jgi:hypothetical protein